MSNSDKLLIELKKNFIQLQNIQNTNKNILSYLPKELVKAIATAKSHLKKNPVPLESAEQAAASSIQEDFKGNYEDFKAAMLRIILKEIIIYLKRDSQKRLRDRGNITVETAFEDFLGISSINSWKAALSTNDKVDQYLQDLYNKYEGQITDFSIKKYAKRAALDIWINFVIEGKETATIDILPNHLGNPNPSNIQLSDSFKDFPKKSWIPKGLIAAIDQFQTDLLAKQPEGFSTFVNEWNRIMQVHFIKYSKKQSKHSEQRKQQNKENIENMFENLRNLIAKGEYFHHKDFLKNENISVEANPDNNCPPENRQNSGKTEISSTTGFIFSPDYHKNTIPIDEALHSFNKAGIPFKPAPIFPTGMSEKNLEKWIQETGILNGEIYEGALNDYRSELNSIAMHLKNDKKANIQITGKSNYFVNNDTSLAVRIARTRAKKIREILINNFDAPGRQISITGKYNANAQIGIEITLSK